MTKSANIKDSEPLTIEQKAELIARMKIAWAKLPADTKAAVAPLLDNAHQQLGDFLSNGTPPDHSVHHILRMKSYLTNDHDGLIRRLDHPAAAPAAAAAAPAIEITLGPQGQIYGTGTYQELDPHWELETGTVWLENLLHKHPFPAGQPQPIQIPDQVTIALAGDFGTGNFGDGDSPSTRISKLIPTLNPHITIHLGDVYYAGTSGEESSKLVTYWPGGSIGSFALNSNHEMYSGGDPYFTETLAAPGFELQAGFSFFALENSKWIIVGLDSAYNANVLKLYMDGSIGNAGGAQAQFLQEMAGRGKKVILLSHHNGLADTGVPGDTPINLFSEVMGAFGGAAPPAYWYWGHVHIGAAYKALDNGMLCRCVGHSAVPWGFASDLQTSQQVQWFEKCSANDPGDDLRVFNGFALLQLDGEKIQETFYDETGQIAWTPEGGDPRNCG